MSERDVTLLDMTHTMARGNCRSMNSEIAGKILSDVRDMSEVRAAVAKELKATRTAGPGQLD